MNTLSIHDIDLYIHAEHEWATDGFDQQGNAGYGLCTEIQEHIGISIASGVIGKQTVNRAESLAVLHAVLTTKLECSINIISDSQITIDDTEKLWKWDSWKPKYILYKDMSNYSIFKTINQIRHLKHERGATITFEKVKSHELDQIPVWDGGAGTKSGFKNKNADRLSDEGVNAECHIWDPSHNHAPAVMVIAGTVEESNAYKCVCAAVDAKLFEVQLNKRKASPRLQHANMHGIWHSACERRCSRYEPISVFLFKLLYRVLPTPRNIQVVNEFLPKLYPDGKCILCKR